VEVGCHAIGYATKANRALSGDEIHVDRPLTAEQWVALDGPRPIRHRDYADLNIKIGRMPKCPRREGDVGGRLKVGRDMREPIDGVAGEEPLDRSTCVRDARELCMASFVALAVRQRHRHI
jgi:hypothetical protein